MIQQSLNQQWQFQAPDGSAWLPAAVPGCIHTDLRRHELIPDPFYGRNEFDLQWIEERDWNYQLSFVPRPELLQNEVVELVCEGLDTVATVHLNGEEILRCENMFHRHRVPVKNLLCEGENRLEIRFESAMEYLRTHRTDFVTREFNDPIGGCTRIRKQQCQFGWDWGPRFVTCGVWRPISLEGWSSNRIESVSIQQTHSPDRVQLSFTPELAREDASATFRVSVSHEGTVIATGEGAAQNLQCEITSPRLWWPAGQGDQPLYDVSVELLNNGQALSSWKRRIGLRTIELDMSPDEFDITGTQGDKINRFGFRVNGRLIFSKGANWIPAHSFVAGLTRADYEPLLRSMTDANMNTLRLWGGGIYEHEELYHLCDELGLLIWHDFMFACTLSPADQVILDSIEREARDQVKRIRHHASLALWCGNNELVLLNNDILGEREDRRTDYGKIFLETLPGVLKETDPITPYIHSSPLYAVAGVPESQTPSYDEHDWKVWHSLAPVEHYETTKHRFNSEFGMQSYPSPAVAETFCPPEELNILSPTFEAHQKHGGGNGIIFHYVAQNFRYPRDYEAISYLSQINQAICMKTAIEHFRRQQPQCLGAMYWQVNDCWPVASWSSIEFGGNWKALHFYARRFFAPALVSIKLQGEDKAGIGNRRSNTRGVVELWTVYDAPQSRRATLSWQLLTLNGEIVLEGSDEVMLEYGESRVQQTLDLASQLSQSGKANVYLRVQLKDAASGEELSRNTALFTAPRFLDLHREPLAVEQKWHSPTTLELQISTSSFRYGVCVEQKPGLQVSDNFFDLHPGETRSVMVHFDATPAQRETAIPRIFSLVDTY
jgi:beta-mannosidase